MKPFHEWVGAMANSISDDSEFVTGYAPSIHMFKRKAWKKTLEQFHISSVDELNEGYMSFFTNYKDNLADKELCKQWVICEEKEHYLEFYKKFEQKLFGGNKNETR